MVRREAETRGGGAVPGRELNSDPLIVGIGSLGAPANHENGAHVPPLEWSSRQAQIHYKENPLLKLKIT